MLEFGLLEFGVWSLGFDVWVVGAWGVELGSWGSWFEALDLGLTLSYGSYSLKYDSRQMFLGVGFTSWRIAPRWLARLGC